MEMLETNLRLVKALKKWDPLGYGEEAYDPEVADSAAAVHFIEDEDKLARKIQGIYEFSFEEIIPLEKCLSIARELLLIKNEGTCSI
ncbi:DUF1871 family protein [Bacillaceae bacterium CLA-AA-H227]|uniref:DUF1871 family protein n=1 Tax=Robertmurraya yapensis (ex Hitch et al 2024) TaxID=3133160 RepID=A0ACC6SAT2_9BACI